MVGAGHFVILGKVLTVVDGGRHCAVYACLVRFVVFLVGELGLVRIGRVVRLIHLAVLSLLLRIGRVRVCSLPPRQVEARVAHRR